MDILTKRGYFQDQDFPLSIIIRDPQPEFPCHSHQFCELVFIMRGSGRHHIGNQHFALSAGDVFVIPKNQEHEYRNVQELSLINILFDPIALGLGDGDIAKIPGFHALFNLGADSRPLSTAMGRQHISPHQVENAKRMIQRLHEELIDKRPGFQRMAMAYFTELIVYTTRRYTKSDPNTKSELLRVGQALAFIEQNYHQKITLGEIAKAANMSERNLRRIFTQAAGQPPSRYIQQVRITHAASLLEFTHRPITDIAFACGFEDSNYFSRQFHKLTGCAPREYRRSQREHGTTKRTEA